MSDGARALLPCPFCGSKAKDGRSRYGFGVICCSNEECGATTLPHTDDVVCIAAWNRRAAPPAQSGAQGWKKDAERYRWLRMHSIFANDSLQEIWFDAGVTAQPQTPIELDAAIDKAMLAAVKEPK